jgi:flagellar FliJ protein
MAGFRFKLEAVLELRRREERDRQLVVASLEHDRLALEERIRSLQRGIVQERHDLRDRLGGGDVIQFANVRVQANAGLHMVARAQRAVLELAGVHQRLDAARAKLLEATRKRKAVEVLRDRRFDEWRREQSRREAAEMDELAVMAAHRKDSA